MSESSFRSTFCKKLVSIDARPIENVLGAGTPDVNFIEGMIELKFLKEWPKKPATPVKFHRLSSAQKVWIGRRWHRGGNVWLLARIASDYLLFRGKDVQPLNTLNRQELMDHALKVWNRQLNWKELKELLTNYRRTSNEG